MEAFQKQLFVLKVLLQLIGDSTGLKVNYAKSNIYPINVSIEKMDILFKTFSYCFGPFLFTYLGLLLGTGKQRIEDFYPWLTRKKD